MTSLTLLLIPFPRPSLPPTFVLSFPPVDSTHERKHMIVVIRAWLTLLNMTFSSSIQFSYVWCNFILLYGWTLHYVCIHPICFIHASVDSLGWFHGLATMNWATIHMGVQLPLWWSDSNSFACVLTREGVPGCYGSYYCAVLVSKCPLSAHPVLCSVKKFLDLGHDIVVFFGVKSLWCCAPEFLHQPRVQMPIKSDDCRGCTDPCQPVYLLLA